MKINFILLFIFLTSFIYSQGNNELKGAITEMKRIYDTSFNIEKGIKSSQKVLELAEKGSSEYFEAIFYLTEWHISERNEVKVLEYLEEMESALKSSNQSRVAKKYWLYWHYLKSRYNQEISYNLEKALIQSIRPFYDAKLHPFIFKKLALICSSIFGQAGQYDIGGMVLKIFKTGQQFNFKNTLEHSKYLLELGKTYIYLEEFKKADETLLKAIELLTPLKEEAPYLLDECKYQLAVNGRLEGSQNPIEILNQLLIEGKREAKYLNLLGQVYSRDDNYKMALPLIQEAFSKLYLNFQPKDIYENPPKNAYTKDVKGTAYLFYYKTWALYQKAQAIEKSGHKEEAIKIFHKAIETGICGVELINKQANSFIGYELGILELNEVNYVVMGGILHVTNALCSIAPSDENFNLYFEYMEKRRSLSVHQALTPSPIPKELDTELKNYITDLEYYELRFSLARTAPSLEEFKDMLTVSLEYEIFYEKYIKNLPKVRLAHNDFEYVSATDIQNQLDENTAFIQYSSMRNNYFAMLITKEKIVPLFLFHQENYETVVYNYIKALKDPFLIQEKKRNQFIDKSKTFYDTFILPFEKDIDKKTHLIISPERELLHLPFETFLASSDKKPYHELNFLIKKHQISYQYSATLHQKIQSKPPINDLSVLGFAPVFSENKGMGSKDRSLHLFKGSDYNSMDKKKFIHLPNTKKEIEAIQRIFKDKGEVTALMNQQATKSNLIDALSNKSYHFVHIATHTMMNFNDHRLSAIACYQEANKDNLFFSYEVNKIPIQADLVILSSCESGIGRIVEGEGVLGLNRSFITSGARNVIFSLWKVDDKYSGELMINFYEHYIKEPSYTSALHHAKLKMLEDPVTANPRFWAAFVLMGK